MGDNEESTNGTGTNTIGQDSIRTNTSNGQTVKSTNNQWNSSLNQGQRWGNTRNNWDLDNMNTTGKDFKGEIEAFGTVLILRYEKVDLKKSFKVFCKKLTNYAIKDIKNS